MTDNKEAESVAWMRIEEAATALRCSRRTIERRITAGVLAVAWQGRVRVVGVVSHDTPGGSGGIHPVTVSAMIQGLQSAAAETRQLAAAVAVDRREWTMAQTIEIERTRRWGRGAWIVAAMLAGVSAFAWQAWRAEVAGAERIRTELQEAQAAAEAARADLRAAVEVFAGIGVALAQDPAMGAVSGSETPSE